MTDDGLWGDPPPSEGKPVDDHGCRVAASIGCGGLTLLAAGLLWIYGGIELLRNQPVLAVGCLAVGFAVFLLMLVGLRR
jgi:apolipoprotein N-acyltransferase